MYQSFFLLLQCVILSCISTHVFGASLKLTAEQLNNSLEKINANETAKTAKITISYQKGSKNPRSEIIQFGKYCEPVDPDSKNESLTLNITNFDDLSEEEKCVVAYTDFDCNEDPEIITEAISNHNSSIHSVQMCSTHLLSILLNISRSEGYRRYVKQVQLLEIQNSNGRFHGANFSSENLISTRTTSDPNPIRKKNPINSITPLTEIIGVME